MLDPNELLENYQIRKIAREYLSGHWGTAIGICFLLGLLGWLSSFIVQLIPIIGFVISILISGVVTLGISIFFLNYLRRGTPIFEEGFNGFNNIGKAFGAALLIALFTFLWSLLLIIPGIIKGISYSQTMYILADHPDMPINEAITRSRRIMDGYKLKYFLLQFSFFGWALLATLFTFGIGYLWLTPYVNMSNTIFYENINNIFGHETYLGYDEDYNQYKFN